MTRDWMSFTPQLELNEVSFRLKSKPSDLLARRPCTLKKDCVCAYVCMYFLLACFPEALSV